jgi:hypothetical protein
MLQDLRRHCICQEFYNPDKKMIACSNEKCKLWLHTECIIDDVLTKTHNRLVSNNGPVAKKEEKLKTELDEESTISTPGAKKNRKKVKDDPEPEKKLYEDLYSAVLIDADKAGIPKVRITAHAGHTWDEDIHCMKCHTRIV